MQSIRTSEQLPTVTAVPTLRASSLEGLLPSRSRLSRFAAYVVTLTVGIGSLPKAADAALMPDGSNDAAFRAPAGQFQGKSVWLFTNYTGGTGKASGVRINDEYVLTAAHNVVSSSVTINSITVGDGLNFNSAPGNSRTTSYGNVTIYPGYATGTSGPDLALVKLQVPLVGPSVTLGAAGAGETIFSVGYGVYGTPSSGFMPRDGNARGWEAHVDTFPPNGLDAAYYDSGDFGFNNAGLTLNGRGAAGDSGGPVFNALGELVGIIVAGSGDGSAEPIGATYYAELANPVVFAWIQANTVVPEPSSLGLLAAAGTGVLARRRSRR